MGAELTVAIDARADQPVAIAGADRVLQSDRKRFNVTPDLPFTGVLYSIENKCPCTHHRRAQVRFISARFQIQICDIFEFSRIRWYTVG